MYVYRLSRMIIREYHLLSFFCLLFVFERENYNSSGETYEYLVIHVAFAQISDDFVFIDS